MPMGIELQAEAVWALDEALEGSPSDLARDVRDMAADETLISWSTADPWVKSFCDLHDIPYAPIILRD